MKKPSVLSPDDDVTTIGHIFDTPIVVKGKTWFPIIELVFWLVMTVVTGKQHPQWSWSKRLGTGALTTLAILGSEWCHNLAHAAAARMIGKPMEALRIMWGMPLVYYKNINDETVTPHQHILRSLGGPILNSAMIPIAMMSKRFTPPGSAAWEAANAAIGMNVLSCTASLLPIPGLDGGPILKWSLVARGNTIQEADETVKRVNLVTGTGLGLAAGIAMKKRRWFVGAILGMFAIVSWAIGFGMLREQ